MAAFWERGKGFETKDAALLDMSFLFPCVGRGGGIRVLFDFCPCQLFISV
jgi:hypothetical protein